MARQVLPIVGAVVGAYFGGPQGAQIGYAIGSLVGNAVDPLVVDGPKIGDVAAQTSSEGVYQPIIFGTAQTFGNVIAQGPNVIRKRKQSQGKGSGPVTVTESLFKTFAIRVCVSWKGEEGIVGISRIWQDGKLVYDTRPESTIPEESAEFATKFRLYKGTADQLADPDLEAIYGVGNTPTYRGRCVVVFPMFDITDTRRIPQFQFEVVTGGTATPPVQIVAFRETDSTVSDDWLSAPDGEDFSGAWQSATELYRRCRFVMTTPDRYLAYGTNKIPAYLKKGESAWQIATGVACSGVGGYKYGACDDTGQVVVIPGGPPIAGGYLNVSTDYGDSFFSVATALDMCTHLGGDFIGYYERKIYASPSGTGGWALTQDMTGIFTTSFGGSRHSSPTIAMFGGTSAVNSLPAIIHSNSSSGFALTEFGFFDGDATYIAAIQSKTEDYVTTYLVVANNGQMAHRVGDYAEWELSTDRMDVPVWDAASNNQGFAIIGNNAAIPRRGQIKISTDGDTLTTSRDDSGLDGNEFWYQIAALAVTAGEVTSEPPRLDQVIAAIHTWCGQPANEYDVTELEDITVDGWILAGAYTGKDCINSMQGLWFFDSPEYDRKIHYRLRGKPSVKQFTIAALLDEPEEATREQVIEYPKKVHLDYQSPAVDYAPAKATSSRSSQNIQVVGEMNVQVPVVMSPDVAAQRVAVMHKVAWADADGEVKFSISDEHLDLVPGDCVDLWLRNIMRRVRCDQIEINPGYLSITGRNDRITAYTSEVTGVTPPPPTPPPPSLVGPTQIMVIDETLRDVDDLSSPVRYIGMGGVSPAWNGALAEVSTDLGTSFSDELQVRAGAIMGTLQQDMTSASRYYTDTVNKIHVQLDYTDGSVDIDSLTQQQFLSEGGAWAIQNDDGTTEVGQFRDADDLGGGLYELSILLRGRQDTPAVAHPAGSRFVLLETIAVVQAPTSQIGVDVYHRATSFGRSPETGTITNGVFAGRSQKEWSVAHVLLERVGDIINVRIVPRDRFGTEMAPLRSTNWRGYEIEFRDALDQIETFVSVSDTYSFDASAMTFPVEVTVRQFNRFASGTSEPRTEEIA